MRTAPQTAWGPHVFTTLAGKEVPMSEGDAGSETPAPVQSREDALALIEKGQQLAGHFPSEEALDRARRLLDGTITQEQGLQELNAKYKRT